MVLHLRVRMETRLTRQCVRSFAELTKSLLPPSETAEKMQALSRTTSLKGLSFSSLVAGWTAHYRSDLQETLYLRMPAG
jgi:hypothetical protein